MSAHANPNIVEDGLVFIYDTANKKSYVGEPTENLITQMAGSTTISYPQTVYISTAVETNVTDSSAPGGKYSRFTGNSDSTNNQLYSTFNSAGIDVRNSTITYSVYLKGSGTCHLTIYADNAGYGTSSTITLTNEWTRYTYTRAVTNYTTNCWVAVRGLLTTTDVYIAGQQAEIKSHATPFVNGTRSATQGLIDRIGNSTIDLSDVSFDSNAQMAFDGTDDYALTTFTPSADDNKTISVWVNFDILTGSYSYVVGLDYSNSTDGFIPISVASYNGNWVLRMRQQLGTLGTNLVVYSNLTINTGEWINLVISSNGSAFNFYKNGVKGSAVSGTNNGRWFSILNEPIMIGASDFLTNQLLSTTDGKIANVSIYNKQLTDAEVLQNYNATKSRFGI